MSGDASKAQMEREIEAKKKKLEELKRLRAARAAQQSMEAAGGNVAAALSPSAAAQPSSSPAASPAAHVKTQSAEDILSSVSSLIGAPAPSPSAAAAAAAASAPAPAAAPRAPSPKLAASAPRHVDIAAGESKIVYEQSTQTEVKRKAEEAAAAAAAAAAASNGSASASTGTSAAPSVWDTMDDDERDEIIHERDDLRAREIALLTRIHDLSAKSASLAAAKENHELAGAPSLSREESEKIQASQEFGSFLDRSSRIMERLLGYEGGRTKGAAGGVGAMASALSSGAAFDYMEDYSARDEALDDSATGTAQKLTPAGIFAHDTGASGSGPLSFARTTGRPVTCLNWSSKFPELVAASYASCNSSMEENGNGNGIDTWMEPDGCVLVWNIHMSKRPEYFFSCQSSVHTIAFHPAHPKLIIGGCESGQLLIWDMRVANKHTPVNRSSLSHGHTHPVFQLHVQPLSSGLYQIVSVSSDGVLCVWQENNLHKPLHEIQLIHTRASVGGEGMVSKEDLTTTCFDLPSRDTSMAILGSDEGRVYKARLHEKEAERIYDVVQAHEAPMTSVEFHPLHKSGQAAAAGASHDLFLTSSYDWTVKLWSQKLSRPLYIFESARDYVYSAAWCPSNPYVFASADGTGKLDVWSLGANEGGDEVEVPAVSVQVGAVMAGAESIAPSVSPSPTPSVSSAPLGDSGADPTAPAPSLAHLRPNQAISKIKWSDNGAIIACGLSSGAVHLYEVSPDLYTPTREGSDRFFARINNRINNAH